MSYENVRRNPHGIYHPNAEDPTHRAYPVAEANRRDEFIENAADAFRQIVVLAADEATTQSDCRWIAERALEAFAALEGGS